MSLDEKKENKEWRKCEFEIELKNKYEIEIQNGMTCIHRNKVNKLSEWNLLYDVLNPPKHTKKLNRHYSPIIKGFMNTWKFKGKFKVFKILLDSGYSTTIVTGRLIQKLNPKEDAVMKWHTKEGSVTTNLKVNIEFTLPELIATKSWRVIVMWMNRLTEDMIWS